MFDRAKRAEWAGTWPLPFVAMLGVTGSGILTFGGGVFMGPMTKAFGWTKPEFTASFGVVLVCSLFVIPLVGRLIDRIGPRRIALAWIVPAAIGTSVLGLADGAVWQWMLLCTVQALLTLVITPPLWLSGVVGRFQASRGLAMAVTLAGSGLGTAMWPVLATLAIERFGWRLAFPILSFGWAAVVLPLAFFFFRGARDHAGPSPRRRDRASSRPAGYARAVLSPTFVCLALSGGIMSVICYGVVIHLVPILQEHGVDPKAAALVAGVAGLISILGRALAGLLLDAVPSRLFAVAIFALPLAVALLLLYGGASVPVLALVSVLLGLAMGAESDILSYVTSRRFDESLFGSLYGVVQSVLSVAAAVGAMLASELYVIGGSYQLFLIVLIPMAAAGATLMAFVGGTRPGAPARDDEVIDLNAAPLPIAVAGLAD